jgi:DNA segregation ATPase FtsK/SpoIIIE, S-DNA-T family
MDLRMTILQPSVAGSAVDVTVRAEPGSPVEQIREELLAVAGAPPELLLWHDGRVVDPASPLGLPPLLDGVVLVAASSADRPPPPVRPMMELHVLTGPQAGSVRALPPGATRIGRSLGNALRLADPEVSREHAELHVAVGGITVRDLGSANGTTVSGVKVPCGERVTVPTGSPIQVGGSTLVLRPPIGEPVVCLPDGAGRLLVNRAPRLAPDRPIPTVRFPDPVPRAERLRLSWPAMVIPALVSVPMALFWHQPALLALALAGPAAMAAQYLTDRHRQRRDRRTSERKQAAATAAAQDELNLMLAEDVAALQAEHPDLAEIAAIAAGPGIRLWERELGRDGLTARVGRSARRPRVSLAGGTAPPLPEHQQVPATIDLARAGTVGLSGSREWVLGVARAVIGQLVTLHSPRELEVMALSGDPMHEVDWEWLCWLPHLRQADAFQAGSLDPSVHRLVILDGAAVLRHRPGVARALAAATAGVSFLCLDDDPARLPRECTVLMSIADPAERTEAGRSLPLATLHDDQGTRQVTDLETATNRWAQVLARRLAPLREVSTSAQQGLPSELSWRQLMAADGLDPTDPEAVLRHWADGAEPRAVLGVHDAGRFTVDLRTDGPHALVAGTTGAGKSELLRTLVTSLAVGSPPDQLTFLLIDYKGGAAFSRCRRLPHVSGLLTDLDDHQARRALASLTSEVRRRERMLREVGASDLAGYQALTRAAEAAPELPRLVIVVDEFRVLSDELPGFVPGLVRVAAVGRSLGVHLVLATQRPAGAVGADLRANVNLRIALRVGDRAESDDVIGAPTAAELDPSAPGRAVARIGPAPAVVFQTARIGGGDDSRAGPQVRLYLPRACAAAEPARRSDCGHADTAVPSSSTSGLPAPADDLERVVEAVCRAAHQAGHLPAQPPWLPPPPDRLSQRSLELLSPDCPEGCGPTAWSDQPGRLTLRIGLADHPGRRLQHSWGWRPEGGNLGITGGPRSGRTTAVRALAAATAVPMYVIHGVGTLSDLEGWPGIAAVVPAGDVERCERLLRLLAALVRDRRSTAEAASPTRAPVLLLIDGWEAMVDAWLPYDHAGSVDDVLRLMRDGPAAAVFTAVTGGRAVVTGLPAAHLVQRLVLPMLDVGDEVLAGVPAALLGRPRNPGRAVWLGPTAQAGVELQLALPAQRPEADQTTPAPAAPFPVPVLPVAVSRRQLGSTSARDAGLLIGLGGDRVTPQHLPVGPGDGVLVAGSPGSGRSTALATIAQAQVARGVRCLMLDSWDPDAAARVAEDPQACVLVDGPMPIPAELDAALQHHRHRGAQTGGSLVVGCEPGQLVTAYTGILSELRPRRTGLLLGALGPGDGEGFGLRLPPRPAGPPGRGLLVVRGQATSVQVALPSWADDPEQQGLRDRRPDPRHPGSPTTIRRVG